MRFKDRVALVTGAGAGIGQATAEQLASEGATVVVVDRDAASGEQVAATIREAGHAALFVEADVSSREQVEEAVAKATSDAGQVDVLVNNAAITNHTHFLDVTEAEFDEVIAVNLKSQFGFAQVIARQLIESNRGGAFVNISSITAELGVPTQPAYASSKGAIISLTRVMAMALAEHGIRVNAVAPGTIATPMVKRSLAEHPELRPQLLARIPLQRFARPSEISSVIAFLASDDASYMTGQVLYPDGGRLALNYTVPVLDEDADE